MPNLSQAEDLQLALEQMREEMRQQSELIARMQLQLDQLTHGPADKASAEKAEPPKAASAAGAGSGAGDEISPELMVVISAAVTVFLGKKVKIHQARMVNPEVVSPWAQQGRVIVQASHYFASQIH